MGILQLNELAFKKRASVTDKGAVAEKNSVHCSHKVKKTENGEKWQVYWNKLKTKLVKTTWKSSNKKK